MTLAEKIINSDAYRSFASEREMADLVRAKGWSTLHGMYYKDLDTNKNRELDIAGQKAWQRTIKKDKIFSSVLFLAEVKSMKDFHLLVSLKEEDRNYPLLIEHVLWSGDSSGKYLELVKNLSEIALSNAQLSKLVEKMNRHAYPRGHMRQAISSTHVRPPKIGLFNTFRETNIGGEKNLENSVLWRASEALRSAFSSIEKSWNRDFLENVQDHFEFSKLEGAKRWLDDAIEYSKEELNNSKIIHPVVFTDAKIWNASADVPTQLPYSRFAMQSNHHSVEWWCDVVNLSHKDEYLERITNHYDSTMFKSIPLGMERLLA